MSFRSCCEIRFSLFVLVLLVVYVYAQSNAGQWQLYQKTGRGECVTVSYDECYSCTTEGVRGNETRYYMCSFPGSDVSCVSTASHQCESPNFVIQAREAGCAGLRLCQIGMKRTAVYLWEAQCDTGLIVRADKDSGWWMQLNRTHVAGYGDAESVSIESNEGSVTFLGLNGTDGIVTSSGSCAMGVWCDGDGDISYRMIEASIESVKHPLAPPYIISLEKNDDFTVSIDGGLENLIEVEGGRTNVNDETLTQMRMTFEDLIVYDLAIENVDSDSPLLSYIVETDDGDTYDETLNCKWKSGWPHGYYSSIAWYYSFGFSGEVIHCNFDSMFDSRSFLAVDALGHYTPPDSGLFPSVASKALNYVKRGLEEWLL